MKVGDRVEYREFGYTFDGLVIDDAGGSLVKVQFDNGVVLGISRQMLSVTMSTEATAPTACIECHGRREVMLFTSVSPCRSCA